MRKLKPHQIIQALEQGLTVEYGFACNDNWEVIAKHNITCEMLFSPNFKWRVVDFEQAQKIDFKFCSIFSKRIRKIFIRHDMTMQDVADKLGWQVHKVSAYYNDRCLLSDDDAQALSDLLAQIGHKFTDVELQEMQKQAIFVDLTKNDLLDEIREKFNQEKPTTRMATLTIPHDNC